MTRARVLSRRMAHLGWLALTLACSGPRATQLMVVIDSDLEVPSQLNSLRVEVEGLGPRRMSSVGELGGAFGQLPRSLALVRDGGPLGPITVTATGFLGATRVVERRAEVSFVENEIRVLRLDLLRRCVLVDCDPGLTCRGDGCVSARVAQSELEAWTGMVEPFDAGVPSDGCLGVELCNESDDDCDGEVDEGIDLTSDPLNCNACNNACSAPDNADATCVSSTCGFTCQDGFDDCNESAADGCEIDLATLDHCGACDEPCRIDNGTATCADRVCRVATCQSGFDDCNADAEDGCEADLASRATCGSCALRCTGSQICCTETEFCPTPACREPTEAVEISAGDAHTCARLLDGTVRCWGDNGEAQLGDGSGTQQPAPVDALSGIDIIAIAAGSTHTCAVGADGSLRCWGKNDRGQCGAPMSGTDVPTPRVVPGVGDALDVVAGSDFTCIRRRSGAVACFGNGGNGRLGRDIGSDHNLVDIAALSDVIDIAGGSDHACAVLASGAVRCWGRDNRDQLGSSTNGGDGPELRAAGSIDSAEEVAAGALHSCARLRSGEVWCWGDNTAGQLGTSVPTDRRVTPMAVPGLDDAVRIFAGGDTTCVLRAGGQLSCFGAGGDGQLGNGGTVSSSTPAPVTGEDDALHAAVGVTHACSVRTDGTAACWGDGGNGRLGNGTFAQALTPSRVLTIP